MGTPPHTRTHPAASAPPPCRHKALTTNEVVAAVLLPSLPWIVCPLIGIAGSVNVSFSSAAADGCCCCCLVLAVVVADASLLLLLLLRLLRLLFAVDVAAADATADATAAAALYCVQLLHGLLRIYFCLDTVLLGLHG